MSSAYLPSWLPMPSLAGVRAVWNRPVTVGRAVLTALGLYAVAFLAHDLYTYYLLLPVDMRGTLSLDPGVYLVSLLFRSFRYLRGLDGTNTSGIRRFVKANAGKEPVYGLSFFGELPMRREPRPQLLIQGVPHRQIPQLLDEGLEKKLKADFRAFAEAHSLTCGESRIERNALALFLTPSPSVSLPHSTHPEFRTPFTRKASAREFAHIHGGESSLHVIMAPLDAALAIERGWAVRHPAAGGLGEYGYAQGRVLLYAPRDEGEEEVIMRLVEAAWRYLTADMTAKA